MRFTRSHFENRYITARVCLCVIVIHVSFYCKPTLVKIHASLWTYMFEVAEGDELDDVSEDRFSFG